MLMANGCPTTKTRTFPPVALHVVGKPACVDEDAAECPSCGGLLDLSQPNLDDEGADLIGSCVDCGRLSLLIDLGAAVTMAILLPTRKDIDLRVLAATEG